VNRKPQRNHGSLAQRPIWGNGLCSTAGISLSPADFRMVAAHGAKNLRACHADSFAGGTLRQGRSSLVSRSFVSP
jgi:hypothetical protein